MRVVRETPLREKAVRGRPWASKSLLGLFDSEAELSSPEKVNLLDYGRVI